MERYSLLKLNPTLQTMIRRELRAKVLRSTLYGALERVGDDVRGRKVVAIDGALTREYFVTRYERYKVHY